MSKELTIKSKDASTEDYAIKVTGVSKTFRIPHEKISSLRGAFVNMFRKNSYEEFQALDNVSFEVKKGEFFGIIGRNGSGKSTLLKILAGIYQPDKPKRGKVYPVKPGEVAGAKHLTGVHIDGLISPFLELGIGFNPELSGRDNVYLNATVLGMSKKQIDQKFNDIVAFSELERFIDQKLKNYSSGMSVRLAFSVAIHANRDILLMDEVLAVGDMNFQSKCLTEFNRYKDLGKTVILVSHDIYTIQKYCDRAMLLRNGKIVKIGNAAEVTGKYLRENISDQENRLAGERKSNNEKENAGKPRKIAEVVDVKFKDGQDKDKNVFETGELIKIEIFYRINEKIKNPIFGITIRDGMKNNVYALNTQYKKMQTGEIEVGTRMVSFLVDNFFATGSYSVSPAIANEFGMMLDLLDNAATLRVINPNFSSQALADFKTEIIIS